MSAEQTELFESLAEHNIPKPTQELQQSRPLADRMRPANLGEYIGQSHLLGPDRPLRKMLERGQCYSMILWGPPGV